MVHEPAGTATSWPMMLVDAVATALMVEIPFVVIAAPVPFSVVNGVVLGRDTGCPE